VTSVDTDRDLCARVASWLWVEVRDQPVDVRAAAGSAEPSWLLIQFRPLHPHDLGGRLGPVLTGLGLSLAMQVRLGRAGDPRTLLRRRHVVDLRLELAPDVPARLLA